MIQLADEAVLTRVVLTAGREAPVRPDRARQTIYRVLAGNLAALLVLILAGYVVGARLAERQALADASRLTQLIGETVVGPRLTGLLADGDPAAIAELDRIFVNRLVEDTSIVRVKVWAPDGRVLYSDEHAEIGREFRLSETQRALLGPGRDAPTAEVSDLNEEENDGDRDLGTRLVEVYADITADDGSPALFEAYLDYDEVRSRRADVFAALAALAAVLVTLFTLVSTWLGRLNLRWLRRRQADLDRLAAEVTDRERRRVARDLHDGAVQELLGLSFLIDGAAACVRRRELQRAADALDRCAQSVQFSVQSLRSTIVEVYPAVLHDRGLGPALEDVVQPLRSRGTQVRVRVDAEQPLPHPITRATYRAAQEAVRNVTRHARATQVSVEVHAGPDTLRLTVDDDGVGIDPACLSDLGGTSGHLGLTTLTDAALELGGRLELTTGVGHGTCLIWEVPL